MQRHPITPVRLTFLLLALAGSGACAGDEVEGGRDPVLAGYPDELEVSPEAPPSGSEERGTEPCLLDDDHWICRLDVQGAGFLALDLGEGRRAYSRTARVRLGAEGLVDGYDLPILGYPAADVDPASPPSPLRPLMLVPPRATGVVRVEVQLDRATSYSPRPPADIGAVTTTVQVYDSLGAEHGLEIYFGQVDEGVWEWSAWATVGDLDGSPDDTPLMVASGTLAFDTSGRLVSESQVQISLAFFGAAPSDLGFDFGEALGEGGDGGGSTSYDSPTSVSFIAQDGYPAGWLESLAVRWNGDLVGTYSNGRAFVQGHLALALFEAPSELAPLAAHVWLATTGSGAAGLGPAADGLRGTVRGWTLISPP